MSGQAADPSKNVVSSTTTVQKPTTVQKHSAVRAKRKVCYIAIFGSPIPQPCDRIDGPIPTTATPMDVVGRYRTDGK